MSNKEALLQDHGLRYFEALCAGNQSQASLIVAQALAAGCSPRSIYLQILIPAQTRIGELWHAGQVTIAQEHLATQITLSEMARLRERMKPRPSLGQNALVSAVHGDHHTVGGRMVADFLYLDGWEVFFMGGNTPAEELVELVRDKKINVVGLSINTSAALKEAEQVINNLKALSKAPKVIVGGSAYGTAPEAFAKLKADAIAENAEQAVLLARKLCGLPHASSSLDQYLRQLGNRIKIYRNERGLSQQQVADAAKLDRAYLSAVEHGKHNVTLGAVFRLADALELSYEELLAIDSATD